LEARVITARSGYSLDTFRLLDGGGALKPDRVERVVATLKTELKRLPKLPKPATRAEPRNARHFAVATRIGARQLSPTRTQIEVICRDRIGLLAQIAMSFSRLKLRVHEARVATFGERVEDFFVLSDQHDQALSEADISALQADLATALGTNAGQAA
jgi:[protein-PII] uridylyltransferase